MLYASLLRGLPARLTPDQLRHIAGDFSGAAQQVASPSDGAMSEEDFASRTRAELIAHIERLRNDTARQIASVPDS